MITSLRAKQSFAATVSKDGLLRGACHRARIRATRSVIASEAKQSIWPRKERMDCFAALAMTSKHTFATSRRDASESVGWVEPSAKPIGYANCDDGYRWRSVAVGTPITERPPHRTVRARFGHTAPTLGV